MAVKQQEAEATIKKLPAVREGVRELGVDAPVEAVRKWVFNKYKLTLTDAVATNYVSTARKEIREGAPKPSKPGPKMKVPAPVKAAVSNGHAGVDAVIAALSTLKGLTTKLGKENVVKLVESL